MVLICCERSASAASLRIEVLCNAVHGTFLRRVQVD